MHKQYGQISMDSVFDSQQEPQIKLLSTPEWCSKCNRELLSYSPKTGIEKNLLSQNLLRNLMSHNNDTKDNTK